MIVLEQTKQTLEAYQGPLADLRLALHMQETADEIAELTARSTEPDFWNDLEKAQQTQTKLKHLQSKIERFAALLRAHEDLETLCLLGEEHEDESVVSEVLAELKNFEHAFENMRLETLFTGEYDNHNALLELHAGAGGTEAQDWTQMLYRMYLRFAEAHDFKITVLDELDGDEAGLKSVSFKVEGENAYGFLRSEMGVHRLVRISPFDSSARRHTSFASLEVLPELDDTIKVEIRPEDVKMDVFRSSGAGGQHVNKTSSAVRLTHIPTGLVVACQNERSQTQNRETAMGMLKAKLFAIQEQERRAMRDDLKGNQMEIAWGSQIRSYVFCPYTLVKDHRTGFEMAQVDNVMDGDIDGFVNAYLSGMKQEK